MKSAAEEIYQRCLMLNLPSCRVPPGRLFEREQPRYQSYGIRIKNYQKAATRLIGGILFGSVFLFIGLVTDSQIFDANDVETGFLRTLVSMVLSGIGTFLIWMASTSILYVTMHENLKVRSIFKAKIYPFSEIASVHFTSFGESLATINLHSRQSFSVKRNIAEELRIKNFFNERGVECNSPDG